MTIAELAAAYRDRRLSPVEVVQNQLDRIARLDSTLHAYLLVQGEEALAAARRAEADLAAGRERGPLFGVPVAHKDIYYTKGVSTTAHSGVLADFVPDYDSTVVARWQQAGAISLGKLNTHEFACGGMDFWGLCVNPHDPTKIPGGSSSGSGSALAAGMAYGATGSDTGGSIRGPAAFCGIAGIKPTYGRASRHGVVPLSWSLDHTGPMARTVADVAVLLQAMSGYDAADPATGRAPVPDYTAALSGDLRGLTLGVPRGWFFADLHPQVAAAVEAALPVLRSLGARVIDVDVPYLPEVAAAGLVILFAEAYSIHERWLAERGDRYGPFARRRIAEGGLYTAAEYLRCLRVRELFVRAVEQVFTQVDALIAPTTLEPAYGKEWLGRYPKDITRTTRPANMAGIPALSVPCGFTPEGLPIGLQVMGRWWDEATVLRIGHAYERATEWHRRRPEIAL